MNFGKWIVVAFVLFAIFIGTLVAVCIKQDVSLVSKSYYKDELAYQDQIKRMDNTRKLGEKPVISKLDNNRIQVAFGKPMQIQQGQIKFFCPSNPAMDKDFDLDMAHDNTQTFETGSFQKGMYKAKLIWTMDGKEYYYEEVVYI